MKKSLFIALACAFVMSFASCEKCVECTYDVNGTSFPSELCGNSDEVEAFQTAAEAAAVLAGTTATCVDK
ncbi:MAG: hypothetical protein AB8G11_11775 [Saprospiraceae bacterium]